VLVSLRERSTSDLVLLIFAATIGLTILAVSSGLVLLELLHPEVDTTLAATALGQVVGIVIGVVVGFVAGRRPSDRRGAAAE
jgi:putative flippase GtrA